MTTQPNSQGGSEPTTDPIAEKLRDKYTFLKPCLVSTEPDAHTVGIKIGVQSFHLDGYQENKESAEWFRLMLGKAFATLTADARADSAARIAELEGKIQTMKNSVTMACVELPNVSDYIQQIEANKDALRAELLQAGRALEFLLDMQNGVPLLDREKQYNQSVDASRAALSLPHLTALLKQEGR